MSASGKKKGKKKWVPVALDAVLPNAVVRASTTSWAEEVDNEMQLSEYAIKKISNLNLPTAPRAACDLVIDESKIPPNGPFMAYLSNLPYEITDDDITSQFKELKVLSVQLPKDDRQDRMKGFGYVHFKDKSNLIAALQQGELTLKGRNVRVSLPEDDQKSERGSRSGGMSFGRNREDRGERSDKPLGEWRAGAPVPHDPDKAAAQKHSGVGFARPQNRDREGGGSGPFRDREGGSGPFRDREGGSGPFRDREGGSGPFRDFRSSFQPADSGPSFSRGSGGFREREGFRDRERDDRDGGRSSDRGGNRPFKRFEPREDRGQRPAFGKRFDRDDRDREMKRDYSERERADEPKQRQKLEVLPRSVPADETSRAQQALPASIFGAAKPVDTTKREMEMEAKLLSMNNATVARGGSPRLTPTSNLSRASSVSSISSIRRREIDSNETANDFNKPSYQLENHDDQSELNNDAEVTKAPTENVWAQRSAAKAVPSAPADDNAENVSSSVMEENAEAVEEDSSSSVYVPPQPGSRTSGNATVTSQDENASTDNPAEDRSSTYSAPRPDTDKYDQRNWTTYGQDTFSGSQQSLSGDGGGRYGGGRGGRYNDNKFGSNFGRDNRRERRDNYRDRDDFRYSQKRGGRDDNYGSGGGSSSSFGKEWNHNNRDGGGSFRNKNNYGGSRRNDRDNGSGGSYNSFRDRNENKSNTYKSFGTPNHHSRTYDSGSEYRGGHGRYDERRSHYNERLTDGEKIVRDSSATETHSSEHEEQPQLDAVESRLKESPELSVAKPLENGGGQENGVTEGDEGVRESSENLAVDGENDNSFKTRKKHKKKKSNVDGEDIAVVAAAAGKRDSRLSDASDRKPRNQKEERKNTDNHVSNDKTPTKNNLKTKENRNEKSAKKSREPRGDDVSQMPKQKEEKTPNFQNKNRFQFLNAED